MMEGGTDKKSGLAIMVQNGCLDIISLPVAFAINRWVSQDKETHSDDIKEQDLLINVQ
jgi:hypothetical protein